MHHILVLGAGKSATILIESLLEDAFEQNWFLHVADIDLAAAEKKIAGFERSAAYGIDQGNHLQLEKLVGMADLVISMLPPHMHLQVAQICLARKKHFLNASYLTPELLALNEDVKAAGLSFLVEMGLDPGIDHMSAMEMIDRIQKDGGSIQSFRSHCGGLISPESDNNPWHYKISWNPGNIIMAGKDGAAYLSAGEHCSVSYTELFDPSRKVYRPGLGDYAWYPNRDSIPYIQKYGLHDVHDFVRTTLRHPDFAQGWKKIVELGLTSETKNIDTAGLSFKTFFEPYLTDFSHWDPLLQTQFNFLALDNPVEINRGICSAAQILQMVLEKKLALEEDDRDMIVMLHELSFIYDKGKESSGTEQKINASLVVKGHDQMHTAMAKTVGLPLAMAVRHILQGGISRKGVFIPIYPDIYEPVLRDLEKKGIVFTITS